MDLDFSFSGDFQLIRSYLQQPRDLSLDVEDANEGRILGRLLGEQD